MRRIELSVCISFGDRNGRDDCIVDYTSKTEIMVTNTVFKLFGTTLKSKLLLGTRFHELTSKDGYTKRSN